MSGYCPDCGNTICLCDEIAECYVPLPNRQMEINELKKKLAEYEEALIEIECFMALTRQDINLPMEIAREVLAKYKVKNE